MITIIPRQTEKSFTQSQKLDTYVFDIPGDMNKNTVSKAVAAEYKVTVLGVRIAIIKGKKKRYVRKGGKVNTGITTGTKKAYVRIKSGESIPVFVGITEEEKNVSEEPKQKRGLLGRVAKNTGAKTGGVTVARTQAKVGEK